ncbi:MAG: HD domain-containing protein [Planctomycetota bacterium]|nr:HD domain-containing protein [Planctomycetota bacterium]
MAMFRQCPGQNMQFWKPSDIFDVPCPSCGNMVEMFRDDIYRHCPSCGTRLANPKMNLGCARWCQHARECLGYDQDAVAAIPGGAGWVAGDVPLAERIIEEVRAEFGDDTRRIAHALAVYDRARDILRSERGNPRIVLAAALLHDIGIKEAERKHGSSASEFHEEEGPPIARRILEKLNVDGPSIVGICRIVGSHHSARYGETPEFKIVWDANMLANLEGLVGGKALEEAEAAIGETFKTGTGREIARTLLAARGVRAG